MQPKPAKRCEATIHTATDVQSGDYFFICSDGVLESLNDATILEIVSNTKLTNLEKINEIEELCETNSKDNFSCHLISVENNPEDKEITKTDDEKTIAVDEKKLTENDIVTVPPVSTPLDPEKKEGSKKIYVIIGVLIAAIVCIGYYLYKNYEFTF